MDIEIEDVGENRTLGSCLRKRGGVLRFIGRGR